MERQVRLKVSMAGTDESHKPGDILTVSQEAAQAWEAAGIAAIVPDGTGAASGTPAQATAQAGRKKRG